MGNVLSFHKKKKSITGGDKNISDNTVCNEEKHPFSFLERPGLSTKGLRVPGQPCQGWLRSGTGSGSPLDSSGASFHGSHRLKCFPSPPHLETQYLRGKHGFVPRSLNPSWNFQKINQCLELAGEMLECHWDISDIWDF